MSQKRCALYRHFDEFDELLYVGISDSPVTRGNSHARSSDWVRYGARFTGVWFDSRAEAEAAERIAIADEKPVFNRADAVGDPFGRIEQYVRDRAAGRAPAGRRERLVTLHEAVARAWAVNVSVRELRRARREPLAHFPDHAGWDRGRRLYSEDELREWTESGIGDVVFLSRAQKRAVRAEARRQRRHRTRGRVYVPSSQLDAAPRRLDPRSTEPWVTLLEAVRAGLVDGPYGAAYRDAVLADGGVSATAGKPVLDRMWREDLSFPQPSGWDGDTPGWHPDVLRRWAAAREAGS